MSPDAPNASEPHEVSVEKKLRDLQELLEISKALSLEKDFDKLIDLIVDAANRVMEAERSSLYVYDPDAGELWTKIAHQTDRFRIKVGQGIAGQVADCRQLMNIPDCDTDARHFKGIDKKSGFHTRSILCGPLVNHEGKLIGVLQLLNKAAAPGYFTAYDESLLEAFSSHIALTLDQARLVQAYLDKQKLMHDLQLAREIQQGLLPKETPKIEGFDVFGWSDACDETGGDYFDYIPMRDGKLGLVIADVTGHGVGPALIMAETRAFARAAAALEGGIDRVLASVNDYLAEDLGGGRFVTLFWGLLDPAGGEFTYSSAGHGHSVICHAADGSLDELESTAPPLGIIRGLEFPMGRPSRLAPGDVLLMTTDGIEEAMNPSSEEYGRDRLRDVLREHAGASAAEIAQNIRNNVLWFMDGAAQRDDLTMVVVKANANA
ncbi:MAG TPA: GAF domain-containing SpoIIE family protein phosphatase [Planctomycetota bacterium]|nr:GAF domain-containing SpoIIE family protein phosphatase [Planctomycetota bacterium]